MLGAGGMAKVFLGYDLQTGKKVALKIVKDHKQWEREREILKRLNHLKGVPELFFAGWEKETFLVMEYIEGNSLKKYSQICGKLQKEQGVLWMIKICRILEKVHEQGIIHMDIKPENILIHPSGSVYLIDFGVSLFEGEKLSGYGTRKYASKKQMKKEEMAGKSFDIYSFGKTMESVMNSSFAEKKIIEKCLAEDKKIQYHTVRQIREDLEKVLWFGRIKKWVVFIFSLSMGYSFWNQTQTMEQREKKVIAQKKSQNEISKAMAYFYGNDGTKKDLELAKTYFQKVTKNKKNASSYLVLLDVLTDETKEVEKDILMKAVLDCQKDIYDFSSAYFYLHFYTSHVEMLPEQALNEDQKILDCIQKYPQNAQQKKQVQTEKVNLYEILAERGNDKKFLEETNRAVKEDLKGEEAWALYGRKLSYLERKEADIRKDYEIFIQKYPKVMDAYIEYGIYLCRHHKIKEAEIVYRKGKKQTGMTSKRAQELRRKLGL